jgi:hypothetical protein
MRLLVLIAMIGGIAAAQDIPPSDRASDRGVTEVQPPSQSMDRGRVGSQPNVPEKPQTWRGVLVDAGCRDRSIANLRAPSSTAPAVPPDSAAVDPADVPNGPAGRDGALDSHGIAVDEKTAQAERTAPLEAHTQDHLTRQLDPSCAINGDTHSFSLLMPNGLLLNLDEGGNTKAFEMFQSSPQGMSILNGNAPGQKPRATVKGVRRGATLNVSNIRLM